MVWQAIGGIASAAGSLFGGTEDEESKTVTRDYLKEKTRTENKARGTSGSFTSSGVDLKRLVTEAQAAGFNPLTILQSGGLSAYGTSATTNFYEDWSKEKIKYTRKQKVKTTGTTSGGGPNAASRIAGAVGNLAGGMSNQQAWNQQQQRNAMEMQMLNAQVNNLRGVGSPSYQGQGFGGSAPRIGGGGSDIFGGGFSNLPEFDPAEPLSPTNTPFELTPPPQMSTGPVVGGWWEPNPWFSDAEWGETRYGDFLGLNPMSPVVAAADYVYNAGRYGDMLNNWANNAGVKQPGTGLISTPVNNALDKLGNTWFLPPAFPTPNPHTSKSGF